MDKCGRWVVVEIFPSAFSVLSQRSVEEGFETGFEGRSGLKPKAWGSGKDVGKEGGKQGEVLQ